MKNHCSKILEICATTIPRIAAIVCVVSGLVLDDVVSVRAQDTSPAPSQALNYLIGPIGIVNFVNYTTTQNGFLVEPPSGITAINGYGTGISFGANLEIPLSHDFRSSLIVDAILHSLPGRFVDINGPSMMPDTPVVNQIMSAYAAGSLHYLQLNVGYKFNIGSGERMPVGLALQFCVSLGLDVGSHLTKMVTYYTTSSGIRDQTFEEPIDGVHAWRFAIRPQIMYDIPLSGSFLLTPQFGFDVPLTQVDNTLEWTASSVYTGIALNFAVGQ